MIDRKWRNLSYYFTKMKNESKWTIGGQARESSCFEILSSVTPWMTAAGNLISAIPRSAF